MQYSMKVDNKQSRYFISRSQTRSRGPGVMLRSRLINPSSRSNANQVTLKRLNNGVAVNLFFALARKERRRKEKKKKIHIFPKIKLTRLLTF